MAAPTPTPYSRNTTLSDVNAQNELDRVASATQQIAAALADVRRGDGAPQNGTVTRDSLHPSIRNLLGIAATPITGLTSFIAAGIGAVLRPLLDKLQESVSLADYGGVCNGIADDGPAIQRAHDAGVKRLRIIGPCFVNTPVVLTHAMTIEGDVWNEAGDTTSGSWLITSRGDFYPFTFSGVAARGSKVRHIGVKQIQPAVVAGQPWVPLDALHFFRVQDCYGGVAFDDMMFHGVSAWVTSYNSGRTRLTNIWGQAYREGVRIDKALDVCHVDGVHNWPFALADNEVLAYTQANCNFMTLGRSDSQQIKSLFVFGCNAALATIETEAGYPTKIDVGILSADFCRYGFLVNSQQATACIATLRHQGQDWAHAGDGTALNGARALHIPANNCRIQIGHLNGERYQDFAVDIGGADSIAFISTMTCDFFDQDGSGDGAIYVTPNVGSLVYVGIANLRPQGVGTPTDQHLRLLSSGSGVAVTTPLLNNVAPNAVNEVRGAAQPEGSLPFIQAIGSDPSIDIGVYAKGPAGRVALNTVLYSGGAKADGLTLPAGFFAWGTLVVNGVEVLVPLYRKA